MFLSCNDIELIMYVVSSVVLGYDILYMFSKKINPVMFLVLLKRIGGHMPMQNS